MAIIKCVMFFKDQGGHGWSESFYREGETADVAMPFLDLLQRRRRQCLTNGFAIPHLRCSVLGNPRDAAFFGYTYADSIGGIDATNVEGKTQYYDAINVRLFAGTQTWRSYLIRAISGTLAFSDGSINGGSTAMSPLLTYCNYIVANGWNLLKSTTETTLRDVTDFAFGFNRRTASLTLGGGVGPIVKGSTILLKGFDYLSNFNGRHKVSGVQGNIVSLERIRGQVFGDVPVEGPYGTVQNVTFSLADISTYALVSGTYKSTGRPSYLRAGRRRQRTA